MSRSRMVLAALAALAAGAAEAQSPAPADAEAYIIWPPDGQEIRAGKLWVRMGLKDMGVAPAEVDRPNTGHHHLLLDVDDLPPLDQEIPSDRNHLHFGGGQTEARLLDLPPGEHTLQMLVGDHEHVPHDPPLLSEKITINVLPYDPATVAPEPESPAPYLYIGWPNDGEVIDSCSFRVWFGLRHMGIAPAEVEAPNTGHHHLLVDVDELPPPGQEIPSDRNHLHFGGGQTETVIELAPGTHTLQLLLGDHEHVPHDPPVVSEKKTITVRC